LSQTVVKEIKKNEFERLIVFSNSDRLRLEQKIIVNFSFTDYFISMLLFLGIYLSAVIAINLH